MCDTNKYEQQLKELRQNLIGKQIDYCFYYNTPASSRVTFTITQVSINEDDAIELSGTDRMISLFGNIHMLSWVKEGASWTLEGVAYNLRGQWPKIEGKPCATWFRPDGATICTPWGR
jgi:hypothetical protein